MSLLELLQERSPPDFEIQHSRKSSRTIGISTVDLYNPSTEASTNTDFKVHWNIDCEMKIERLEKVVIDTEDKIESLEKRSNVGIVGNFISIALSVIVLLLLGSIYIQSTIL
jgi:hypothetical protein